jgi:hypothetical protein
VQDDPSDREILFISYRDTDTRDFWRWRPGEPFDHDNLVVNIL